jgi:hypothetical protein
VDERQPGEHPNHLLAHWVGLIQNPGEAFAIAFHTAYYLLGLYEVVTVTALGCYWVTLSEWLGDAKSSLGGATSSLGGATSSLGDAQGSLGDV